MRRRVSAMSARRAGSLTGDMTQSSRSGRFVLSRFVLGAATVATGLIAGAFYVFACAVMPGLARSDDRVYVSVMRDINEVIQNPVFFLSFLGAPALTAAAAWQARGSRHRWWVWAALAASALAFLVTVVFNVPLNDDLARGGDPGALREEFEDPWVAWNVVRAVLLTVALGLLVKATGSRAARVDQCLGRQRLPAEERRPARAPGAPAEARECRREVLVPDEPGLSAGATRGRAGRRDRANGAGRGAG